MKTFITGLVVVVGLVASPLTEAAVGDGSARLGKNPIVARGESPSGMGWSIRASAFDKQIQFEFSFSPPGYSDAGYFTGLPLPLPKSFVLTANPGSDLNPRGEADVSGITDRRVHRLRLRLSDGSRAWFKPEKPRHAAVKKVKALRGVRVFDHFIDPQSSPATLRAYGRDGHLLDKVRLP